MTARDTTPTDVEHSEIDVEGRLRAAVENDIRLFDSMFRRMHECWIGTGSSYEDGSASNDYRVWREEIAARTTHLRWVLRDLDAIKALKHPEALLTREDGTRSTGGGRHG